MRHEAAPPVTVVVPVYNGFPALARCLQALEKHSARARVLLIDDASTDPRVAPLLQQFSARNHWELQQHRDNRGFVLTANTGLQQADGHVVLLNADAIVTPHWLSAVDQAIANHPDLATATPWSNNAEICSFPRFLAAQPVPVYRDELAESLYQYHTPEYPEIPTGVGFCLLITAEAQKHIGVLDEATFGHGYGEENDYCLRAQAAGMKNILIDNAYVAHIGNQSFCDLNLKADEQSMQRLLRKHPHYRQMIAEYITADPLAPLRCEIINTLKKQRPQLAAQLENVHDEH